jgi:hypothetical protein
MFVNLACHISPNIFQYSIQSFTNLPIEVSRGHNIPSQPSFWPVDHDFTLKPKRLKIWKLVKIFKFSYLNSFYSLNYLKYSQLRSGEVARWLSSTCLVFVSSWARSPAPPKKFNLKVVFQLYMIFITSNNQWGCYIDPRSSHREFQWTFLYRLAW